MRDAVVVGLSLGGLVAQGLAVKRLDLVRGMVLSNTAAKIGSAEMWGARVAQVQARGLADYAPGAMERMFGRRWQDVAGMPRVRAMLEGDGCARLGGLCIGDCGHGFLHANGGADLADFGDCRGQ